MSEHYTVELRKKLREEYDEQVFRYSHLLHGKFEEVGFEFMNLKRSGSYTPRPNALRNLYYIDREYSV